MTTKIEEQIITVEFQNPGQYWIGDLFYVLNEEWEELCDLILCENSIDREGKHALKDGRTFCLFTTKHGDGIYSDNLGNFYPVDDGIIGMIGLEDINLNFKENDIDLGNIIKFDSTFECMKLKQRMTITAMNLMMKIIIKH